MKLISLATWGCRIKEPLFEYIKNNSDSVDIFCFQEILKGGAGKTERDEIKSAYEDISALLPNHTGYFLEYGAGGYYGEASDKLDFKYGVACFIRSDLKQSFVDGIRLYDPERKWSDHSVLMAVGAALTVKVGDILVINVHGLWQSGIKTDTEAKIEQSRKILELAKKNEGRKIICGDFNLLPDTKSIQILGDEYKNLIQEYNITKTRSSFYKKEIRYADYVFIDKDVTINNFSVPDLNISDHLPLVLDFK